MVNRKAVRAITPMKIITRKMLSAALDAVNFLIELITLFVMLGPPMMSNVLFSTWNSKQSHRAFVHRVGLPTIFRIKIFPHSWLLCEDGN